MPEGDIIHRTARVLHRALAGHEVVAFETAHAHLDRVAIDTPLVGRVVQQVRALGKHVLMHFSGDLTLHTHMRMSGSWHLYRPGERWKARRAAMRIVVATQEVVAVAFDVPVARFLTARQLDRDATLRRLGPDLLADDFDQKTALANMRACAEADVASALLDQRVVAGAGNVFKSEVLFVAGISPFARVGSLPDERLLAVLVATRHLMQANALHHASHLTSRRRTTRSLDPAKRLWVYGRAGRPCRRCGSPIQAAKQGADARATYWCPTCQAPAPQRA